MFTVVVLQFVDGAFAVGLGSTGAHAAIDELPSNLVQLTTTRAQAERYECNDEHFFGY
ncbi:hypothetical protein [uncultured Stenotrophomonas sp.]|uniref:hypothetical protein n=1 Tax=uncultured Stenotrophomonas sp. TaxID=165438 RepID=UPI0025F919AC|nr:hypothetical protein [uncultured Stenotrophomonas sp.]